jgi:hypothetical protein
MIIQNWLISEEEKNRILNLHESATKKLYLVNEQSSQNVKNLSFNITKSFPSGKYELKDTSEIDDTIKKIQDLLSSGQGSFDTITIESSESRVPTKNIGMEPGELSKKRAESVEKYLKSKLGDSVKIISNPLGLQGPKWEESKGADHPDYTKYQYVTLNLSGYVGCVDKVFNITGGIGDKALDYILPDSINSLKGSGFLTLETGSIPDRLFCFDDKKNMTYDSGYIATKPYANSEIKYLPSSILMLTNVMNSGSIAVSGNKIILQKISTANDLIDLCFNNPKIKTLLSNNIKDDKKIKTLLNNAYKFPFQISNPFIELLKLFNSGVSDFVLYEITNKPLKVAYDSNKGQKETSVYSPIGGPGLGETGYKIIISTCS